MMYTRFTVIGKSNVEKRPSYIKGGQNLKCEKTLFRAKYPEPVKICEDTPPCRNNTEREEKELEFVFSPEESEVAEYQERTNVSSRLMSGFAVVFLGIVFILSVYVSGIQAPDYVRSAFMASYGYLSERYGEMLYDGVKKAKAEDFDAVAGDQAFIEENENSEISYDSGEGSFIANAVLSQSSEKKTEESTASVAGAYSELDASEKEVQDGAVIVSRNLSRASDKVYAINETSLSLDTEALAVAEYPIPAYSGGDGPLVLIVHTHGTECYADSTADGGVRCTDTDKNIVRVGEELSEILNSYGIPTLHSKTMHDEISFITAYQSSGKEVKQLLSSYPSIKYVIDVHRDAIPNEKDARVKPYAEINGEGAAQIMLVMGTNGGGGNHPGYMNNLTVAAHVQKRLNDIYPSLARPINLRNAIFNQNLSAGYLLLEVGSDANTLSEALSAVRMFARGFAETVLKGE